MKPLVPVVVAAAAMVALAVFVSPVASRSGDDSAVGSSPDATIMLSNFQPASIVIGQPNFTSGFPNQAMDTPAADTDAGGLGGVGVVPTGAIYISDYENRRVLGFDAIPSSNDASADFVLGQADFSSTVQDDGANQFGGPQSPVVFKNMLFVADFYNSRVMIWKKAPTTNQVPANIVLGQKKFGTRTQACGATGMSAPETLSVGGGKLVVNRFRQLPRAHLQKDSQEERCEAGRRARSEEPDHLRRAQQRQWSSGGTERRQFQLPGRRLDRRHPAGGRG